MWAFRRASVSLRNYGFRIRISQSYFAREDIVESFQLISDNKCQSSKRFYCTEPVCENVSSLKLHFSSQAGAEGAEDGVYELGVSDSSKAENENCDDSISELEFSGEVDENEVETSQYEKRDASALFKAIMDSQGLSVRDTLAKWVAEGNALTQQEVSLAMRSFRKLRMNKKSLELSEWLETSDQFEFNERNYASRLDLIAKLHGIKKAEKYIERIPDSYKVELIYRTLLANCVYLNKVKKAEEVFKKMKDLGLPITPFSYDQLLILYKRRDKKKFADLVLLMKKENVKPSLVTYKLLIANEGDITGIEQILEKMKAEGVEPDTHTKFILARHYISFGLKDKAEAVLNEMEGSNLKENRQVCRSLILLYGELGEADQVKRVWKVCETDPNFLECMAAIQAWGKLKKIEEAEAVFDRTLKIWKQPSSKQYTTLLKVYANNKLLGKSEDLVKRMSDSGCRVGPLAWNALVKLYVEEGEVEKADSVLMKFTQQSPMKPLPSTYKALLVQYAKRGDVHNSEKIIYRMREDGYPIQFRHFEDLLQSYLNAKKPAYGIRERLKADKIFPNNILLGLVKQVDPFRTTVASYLVD